MRKFCIGIVSLVFTGILSAQVIIPSVGGVLTSSTNQISFTLGETLIPTLSTAGIMITQGYQQPEVLPSLSLQRVNSDNLVAFIENGKAKLLWGTTPNARASNLALERLNNETGNYETIETLPYQASKGFTLEEYGFADKDPQDGENVYRIMQIVPQQLPIVSETRKLKFNASEFISLYPNPVVDYVNLDLSAYVDRSANIAIYSYSGQLMLQQKIDKIASESYKVSLNNIQTGQYQLRIKVADKKNLITKPLVITK
jgi:Secretion system C-terminal sorting domain